MAELSQFEQLKGANPDAWKEFYPDYEPNDDVRIAKVRAVAAGATPEQRASAAQRNPRNAAFQTTPLSDADVALAREKLGDELDLGDIREVPDVIIGSSGSFQSLAEADAVLSSGQTVSTDQAARAEDANTQRPEPESGTTEDTISSGSRDFLSESGPLGMGPGGPMAPGGGSTFAPGRPGEPTIPETVTDDQGDESGEESEEEIAPDVTIGETSLPREFSTVIKPKPNILSEFSSYSYSVSIYLLQPGEYTQMITNGEKNLLNSTLLLQSGGITNGTNSNDSRRNTFFDVDFYIDNVEIESLVTGKATQGAHNATRMRFDVTEPYGISFLDRLRSAVADFRGSDQNMFSQHYLMVVRFYGYDEAGKLVQPQNKPEETSDSNSVIEKFIPFIFENIKFTVANQSVVYQCSAVAINQYFGLGQLTSTVPYNIEISGQTLSELFNGKSVIENSDDDSSKGTIIQGLVKALNDFEREKEKETGALANEYVIKLDENLKNAKMAQLPEETYLANLPVEGRTNQTIAQRTGIDNNRRKYGIIAGQSIVQVIDLLVRASNYITDQQIAKITEDPAVDRRTGLNDKNEKYIYESSGDPIGWFKITTHIEPKQYDERRGEYSYIITYIVSTYKVNDLKSEFFRQPSFSGVHKKYDYWFTGENIEVLDFEQQFNALYYLNMAPQRVLLEAGIDPRQRRNSTTKFTTQDTSDQSEVMGTGESARPSADAASSLYSPSDQGMAEIKILGDPAWIQQSELFYNNNNGVNYAPFLPDDSINYDSQEPLFQISFNLPTDYDVDRSGTMPVRKFNQVEDFQPGSHRFIYRANRVVNSFSGGVFTQQISATQIFDTTGGTDSVENDENENVIFPRLGDDIILPGTSSDPESATDANFYGPRRNSNPFSSIGVDLIPTDPEQDDD